MPATADYLAEHPFADPDIVNPPEAPTYRYRPDLNTLVDLAGVETDNLSAGSRIDIIVNNLLQTYVLQAGTPTGSVLEVVPDDYDVSLNQQYWLLVADGAASSLPGTINFADILGTIGLDQLPPNSVGTLDTINEDALYFFDDSAGVPKLISATEAVGFISGVITFDDLAGTIGLDQFPVGSVATLDSIDEDAVYFFDNVLFTPKLINSTNLSTFIGHTITFANINGTISLSQLPPGTAATVETIGEDAFFFFNDTTGLPELISVSDAAALIGGGGGGSSLLETKIARVDLSGDDGTGTIGDRGLPFLTVQAALDAIDAVDPGGGFNYVVDIGNNNFSEALTTPLTYVAFTGTGLAGSGANACNSITFTTNNAVNLNLQDCTINSVDASAGGSTQIQIELQNAYIGSNITCSGAVNVFGTSTSFDSIAGSITASGSVYLGAINVSGSITAGGSITMYGGVCFGTLSAPGFNIFLSPAVIGTDNATGTYQGLPTINSAGSEVWATGVLIDHIVACGTLHLKDARVVGSNAATSTVYSDVFLAGDDTAYDATTWNGNMRTPTKNAIRDKFESLVIGTDVQAHDTDLDTLAGLTATTNNFIVSVSSAWASRTPTQVKATLAIANTDVSGLGTASTLASDTDGTLATNSDSRIATQKAVKTYIDGINTALVAAIAALDSKNEVAYCSTSALPTCTYSNGSSGVGATLTATTNGPLIVDSATIVVGAVGLGVLVAGQASDFQNGWYTITQQGVVAVSPWILTRRTTDDQAAEIGPGYLTAVEAPTGLTAGTANNQKVFLSISPTPFVVGTDSLTFAMVGGTYTAGNGLSLSGTAFSINTAVTADLSTAQSLTNKKLGSLTNNGFVKTGSGDGTLSVDTATYQPLDGDLTTLAGLTATTDNFIVSVSSAWASRTPSQVRSTLGLVIGTNVQAWDADLDTLAGLTATTDNFIVSVSSAWASRTPAQVRTTLGLVVGTDVQAYDADLATIAGLTATTDNFIVSVSSAWASRTPSQVKTTLGLVIGTNVQAWDTDLDTWAGITPGTGVGTFLATPSSANLLACMTDETGTGACVFANTPTLVTPVLGVATGTSIVLSSFLNEAKGADIASATTTDIGAATGNYVVVTGTVTITGLGTVQAGTRRNVKFSGALTLTHNASSLILPGSANITTVAGDTAIFISLGSGNWICTNYQPVTWTGTGTQVMATSPTFVTPLLGTPTSGTLTNCTGLPIAGLTASTSTALGVGSVELGNASDTTLARVSAGVFSVEGVTVPNVNNLASSGSGVAPTFVAVGVPVVAILTGANLKSNATLDIFTVPTSRTFVVFSSLVIITAVTSGAAVAFAYQIRDSTSSNGLTAGAAAASAAPTVGKTLSQIPAAASGPWVSVAAAAKVQIAITTGYTTSTTVTGDVFVLGTYTT